MSIGSCLLINRAAEIQHLDDTGRAEVKIGTDDFHQLFIAQLSCAESIYHDGGWVGHADCIGQLDFTLVGQSGCHDILRHITGCIGSGTVHLGAVLAGKRRRRDVHNRRRYPQ